MAASSFLNIYEERLRRINTQFEFFRYAWKNLSKTKRRQFFRDKSEAVERRLMKDFEPLIQAKLEPQARKASRTIARMQYGPAELNLHETELFVDGLTRSEILLLVANFEVFLKALHEALLKAKPQVLGVVNPQRQEKWESIFQNWPNDFLKGAIAKEVKRLDKED